MAKSTKTIKSDDGIDTVIAPAKKTRKPRTTVAKTPKKTEEIKAEVKDVANDVSEKLKAEIEEVIADNIDVAPEGSMWNKVFRNVVIVVAAVAAVSIVYNILT